MIAVVTGIPVSVRSSSSSALPMIVYTLRGGATAVIWTDVDPAVRLPPRRRHPRRGRCCRTSRAAGATVVDAGSAAGKFNVIDAVWNPHEDLHALVRADRRHAPDPRRRRAPISSSCSACSRRARGRTRRWGVFASGIVVFAQFALFLLIGVMLWVFYQQTPLPVPVDRADKIVSVYVLHNLGPGLAGLIIAAIVAAALSPSINALAATTVNDFYRPYVRPDADDAHLLRVSRIATRRLGPRAAGRRARRAVHAAGRPRRRPDRARPVVGRGARRVPDRHASARRSAATPCSRGWSPASAPCSPSWLDVADRLDLARAHRHDRDRRPSR